MDGLTPHETARAADASAVWDAVQAHLHEMVNLARELERHAGGQEAARLRRLRQLAEEVTAYLRPRA